jgi:hypothetical protein
MQREEGRKLLQAAINASPSNAKYRFSLGVAYQVGSLPDMTQHGSVLLGPHLHVECPRMRPLLCWLLSMAWHFISLFNVRCLNRGLGARQRRWRPLREQTRRTQ